MAELTCMCGVICKDLAGKIEAVISDANSIYLPSSQLQRSWKQRSHAKKHAWGSCNTLSYLLVATAAKDDVNRTGIEDALRKLVQCINFAHVLNDKITLGSISALQMVSKETWGDNELIGICITACLNCIQKKRKNMSKVCYNEMQSLLTKVIKYARKTDLLICFEQDDIRENTFDFLYHWMVNGGNMDYETFESVHDALICESISSKVDISLIQKFSSRTTFERRKIESPAFVSNDGLVDSPKIKTEIDSDEENEL